MTTGVPHNVETICVPKGSHECFPVIGNGTTVNLNLLG